MVEISAKIAYRVRHLMLLKYETVNRMLTVEIIWAVRPRNHLFCVEWDINISINQKILLFTKKHTRQAGNKSITHTHTHNHFTTLWTLSGTTQESWYVVPQGGNNTGRRTNNPDGLSPIQTNWCPHLCHPHHFYAGCPSWHNPPNLPWIGTGTKYAGLHTRWLGSINQSTHATIVCSPVHI